MTHKHLQEIDPSTLSPEELRERLRWRDEHPAEVIRAEREREVQRRLGQRQLLAAGVPGPRGGQGFSHSAPHLLPPPYLETSASRRAEAHKAWRTLAELDGQARRG